MAIELPHDPRIVLEHRRRLGWSQSCLAEKAGTSTKSIGRLESAARSNPAPYTVATVARALGVRPAWLVREDTLLRFLGDRLPVLHAAASTGSAFELHGGSSCVIRPVHLTGPPAAALLDRIAPCHLAKPAARGPIVFAGVFVVGAVMLVKGVVAISLAFAAGCPAFAAQRGDSPGPAADVPPTVPPAPKRDPVHRAMYLAAAHYRLNTQRRDDMYPVLAVAVAASRRGAPAADIQAQVSEVQNALWGRDDFDEATLAAAESLAADGDPLRAVGAALRGGDVHWTAVPRTRTVATLAAARQQILRHYDDAYHAHPELRQWPLPDDLLGFPPDAARDQVVAALPGVGREMMSLANADDAARLTTLRASTDTLWQELRTLREHASPDLARDLRAYLDDAATRVQNEQQAIDQATRIEGIESLVYLGATLVGIRDPATGAKLQTAGNTLIGLHESWSKFGRASEGVKGLAAATLTTDFVSAAMTLVGLLVDTGPTADELILDGIASLGTQIDATRRQMHERFNWVDKRLQRLHEDVAARLGELHREVRAGRAEAARIAAVIRLELEAQRRALGAIYPTLVHRTGVLLERIDDSAVAGCFNRKTMTSTEYDRCLAQIRAIALDGSLASQQLPLPASADQLEAVLRHSPNAMTQAVASEFAARRPGSCVPAVDPAKWALLARKHDEFVRRWPAHRALASGDDGGYAALMRRHRGCLLRHANDIAEDFVALGQSDNGHGAATAVGSLIAEVRSRVEDLRGALRDAARAQRRVWRRRDGLDWRRAPDRWQKVDDDLLPAIEHRIADCEPKDLRAVGSGSSLAYHLAPRKLRRIRLPRALQGMYALGMGELRVCALGSIDTHSVRLSKPPAHDDRDNTAAYVAEVSAIARIAVRFQGSCSERVQFDASRTGYWRSLFHLDVDHGRAWEDPFLRTRYVGRGILAKRITERLSEPQRDKIKVHASANEVNERLAMGSAFGEALGSVRRSVRGWTRKAERHCKVAYTSRFARIRDDRLAVVERDPRVQRAVQAYDETATRASALVRAWLRFAMQDAIPRSDLVSGLASGAIRLPRWRDTRSMEKRPFDHVLNQPERVEDRVDLYQRAVGSDEVRRVAASGLTGHPEIARVVFDSLDPGHPVVVASRTAPPGVPSG